MARKHIVIGIPTFGAVSMRWAMAYHQIAMPMNCRVSRIVEQGLEVGIARNKIVAHALALNPVPSHLFFLDDDVIPPTPFPLLQLLKDDLDIVSGIYFTKNVFAEPLAFQSPGNGVLNYVPGSGIHPVYGHGMGLCLIRTEVFCKLRDEGNLGVDVLGNPRWFYTGGDQPEEPVHTEDMWFCKHASELGYQLHVDMSPYCFGWHFDSETQTGFPRLQWDEYLKTGSASWEIPDGNS